MFIIYLTIFGNIFWTMKKEMDIKELKVELDILMVNPNHYSLNGDIKPDAVILFHNYYKWRVYYFDERGGKNDEHEFNSQEDACQYIHKLFREMKDIEDKFAINS